MPVIEERSKVSRLSSGAIWAGGLSHAAGLGACCIPAGVLGIWHCLRESLLLCLVPQALRPALLCHSAGSQLPAKQATLHPALQPYTWMLGCCCMHASWPEHHAWPVYHASRHAHWCVMQHEGSCSLTRQHSIALDACWCYLESCNAMPAHELTVGCVPTVPQPA